MVDLTKRVDKCVDAINDATQDLNVTERGMVLAWLAELIKVTYELDVLNGVRHAQSDKTGKEKEE